mgnify:CR=1 FL=1
MALSFKSIKNGWQRISLGRETLNFGDGAHLSFSPIVGRVWNNKYRHAGNTYEIGQHGFARDMNFKLTYKEDKGAVYWLESTPDTLGKFPFPFRLLVGYLLEENKITVNGV